MRMIPNEAQKAKMKKDGSILKYLYGAAGIGKGIAAGGITLMVCGAALTALVIPAGMTQALVMAGAVILPGALLTIFGSAKQKKRDDNWVKAYMEASGLSEEEVLQAEAEFQAPGAILLGFYGSSKKDLRQGGFLSAHYLKLPGISPMIYRVEDLVACFFSEKYLCQDGGYAKAALIYTKDPDKYSEYVDVSEKRCQDAIQAIAEANPSIITSPYFIYEDQKYDAAQQRQEVVALHNRVMAQAAAEAGDGT